MAYNSKPIIHFEFRYHFVERSVMKMRKAYDTFLQSEVSADLAAKSGGVEPYRYECAHCGEEVRLVAIYSIRMVPHFRHLSGNNDVTCEKYIGQYGAISTDSRSRKSKNERAEFYFDKGTKMFYLGLCFSTDEITAYEHLTTTFEFRASIQEQAFFTLCINSRNFDSDVQRMIPIEKFSYNYFLSNTLNNVKRKYEVFKNSIENSPTFFKVQGNDINYKAKLVRGVILYTNVSYLVVFQSKYIYPQDCSLPSDIKVDDTFQFETMGRKFLGKILTIKAKTTQIDSLISLWGYQLEVSETLTLLWPPAVLLNEVSVINSEYVFLFSSFELQAHGNINVHSEDITRIASGISKVAVKSKTKVYRKNAEIVIDKSKQYSDNFDVISFMEIYEDAYLVPDDSLHFLFNCSGVLPMSNGQFVLLTPGSVIKRYHFGYLDGCVYPRKQNELTNEQLLNDILAHYKRTEIFTIDFFDSIELSEVALQYVERCQASGLINSAVKQFIMEGRI